MATMTRPQIARPGRERQRQSGVCPLPPMPADPTRTCRWCLGPMFRAGDGQAFCQRGCFNAEQAFYTNTCIDCRREFQTGRGPSEEQCWQCVRREHARTVAMYAEPAPADRGYMADMRKKGANREAMAIKDGER